MLDKKHNLKIRKKAKISKRDFKEKTRQETKERETISEKKVAIEYFDVVLFMKLKQRRKKMKEREKDKEQK